MTKFRKKPVVIDAWQLGSGEPKPDWLKTDSVTIHPDRAWIYTLEGTMEASAWGMSPR